MSPINLSFNRKFSSLLTQYFVRHKFEPNHLTTAGLLLGVLAGYCFSGGTRIWLLAGALSLHLSFILDNCDGEVARIRRRVTRFGKWYDLLADVTVDVAFWTGLALGAERIGLHSHLLFWLLLAIMGSFLNMALVIWERKVGCSTSIHSFFKRPKSGSNPITVFLDYLSHNGDAILLIWFMAFLGDPRLFLVCGAIYIHVLWAMRFFINIKSLSPWYILSKPSTLLKGLFLALGVLILSYVAGSISWEDLSNLFVRGGAALCFVVLVYPLSSFFHVMGLRCLFSGKVRKVLSFRKLFYVYFVGDSINKVTPFVDIGGEPLKAILIFKKRLASLEEAIVAVYMSRVVYIASEVIFVCLGLYLLFAYAPPMGFVTVLWVGIGMTLIYLGIFISAQLNGAIKLIPQVHRKLHSLHEDPRQAEWEQTEKALRTFYTYRFVDFVLSTFWQTLGWIFLLLEIYMTFRILGIEMSLREAFLLQSLLQVIKTLSFLIPGNLGTQEGGLSYLAVQLGFSATDGFALSIIKRVRSFFWSLVGMACLWVNGLRK
jgi:glycosyltransferase 2 family protein